MNRLALLAAALLLLAPAAPAQTLDEIERREAAVYEAWARTPLSIRRAVFVVGEPAGFGMYVKRATNVFAPTDTLRAYVEPVGYGWKPDAEGGYEFGFDVDFAIKTAEGVAVAAQRDFARLVKRSRVRNREFMLVLTLNLTDAEPGDYLLTYTLHDIAGGKTASFDLPFAIAR
jgi:hypothetical protein